MPLHSFNRKSHAKTITLREMAHHDSSNHSKEVEEGDTFAATVSPRSLFRDFHDLEHSDEENQSPPRAKPLKRENSLISKGSPPLQTTLNFQIRKNPATVLQPTEGKKPLLLGKSGAVATKRDAAGRPVGEKVSPFPCVSDGVLKMSLKENVDEPDSFNSRSRPKRTAFESVIRQNTPVLPPAIPIVKPIPRSIGTGRTGDYAQSSLLPLVKSTKHPDLRCITPSTLASVIHHRHFQDQIERMWIVDCRYPFEYIAGHIANAINVYHRGELQKLFLDVPYKRKDPSKRHIIVFHCEFSSQRGPDMLRFLRARDRELNQHCYPMLSYPELYLLEGGYKAFFECCSDLCEPRFYQPMVAEAHKQDLAFYKAKAKSFQNPSASSSGTSSSTAFSRRL